MRTLDRRFLLALPLLSLAACGPKAVQLYDGPKLDESEVTYMFTNPHLKMVVDRQNTIEDQSLQKLELPRGHHVAEVRCIYTPDMTYHPAKGVDPECQRTAEGGLQGVAAHRGGHGRGARATSTSRGPTTSATRGTFPGCRVRMFDVTNESGGHKVDFY